MDVQLKGAELVLTASRGEYAGRPYMFRGCDGADYSNKDAAVQDGSPEAPKGGLKLWYDAAVDATSQSTVKSRSTQHSGRTEARAKFLVSLMGFTADEAIGKFTKKENILGEVDLDDEGMLSHQHCAIAIALSTGLRSPALYVSVCESEVHQIA